MRRRNANPRDVATEPVNVTPLIDVVMCLIIFFLIVGKLAGDQAALVRLPASTIGRGERDDRAVIVSISPAPPRAALSPTPSAQAPTMWSGVAALVSVDGTPATSPAQLQTLLKDRGAAKLRAAGQDDTDLASLPVVVRADRDLPFAAVEPALAALAALGIAQVDYATQRLDAPDAGGATP
jgi:biopolymer transport protein ExbD